MQDRPKEHIPKALQENLVECWAALWQAQSDDDQLCLSQLLAKDVDFDRQLSRVLVCSEFVAQWCQRHPRLFRDLLSSGDLKQSYDSGHYRVTLQQLMPGQCSEDDLAVTLRQYRQREMVRLIFRDFTRQSTMQETTRDVTLLAEACIDTALGVLYEGLCQEMGKPLSQADNSAQHLVVLGMGKLGAHELNLSSDIDLIFTYADKGATQGGKRSYDNHEFFTRLGQRLIKALEVLTIDGFVFRVDMRLRPYGQSGALVLSFDAMEEYYQSQGREWERYAMIKARVVAGDREAGQRLLASLRPFVYRRYIDYSVIDSLREMKTMIDREVKRRGKSGDIKLGFGGIRQIEFIAQSFQLIRGGRDTALQQRSVQRVLTLLGELECMSGEAVEELQQAYVFLRNTEHAIQGYQDKQSQTLPSEDLDRLRLAYTMGYEDWDTFEAALSQHRNHVDEHFSQIVSVPRKTDSGEVSSALEHDWLVLWPEELEAGVACDILRRGAYEDAEASWYLLSTLRQSNLYAVMQSLGRQRLDQFMPIMLQAVAHSSNPSRTLARILPLVEAVARRSAYLVLLMENPQALEQVVLLFDACQWIAQQVTRQPVLLDELLNIENLYRVPEVAMLRDDLRQQLLRLPWDDLEAHFEGLRYFKLAHQLHVTAAEIAGKLPLMKVSSYLSYIAETLLEQVLVLAWQQLTARYGFPTDSQGLPYDQDFIVIGYGKLGGRELSHASDLDLVFIHDVVPEGVTNGDRSISNAVFFARLGQLIINMLTTRTPLGLLYEVDMRLRPSGESGLLVSSMKAFIEYQNRSAWNWEHQALVRARVVVGDKRPKRIFESTRATILCKQRDLTTLRRQVVEMRQKMRGHLLPSGLKSKKDGVFDLKQGRGGIVDIEFMVQYAVLAWAHEYPTLVRYNDNIHILEALGEAALFGVDEASALTEAYKTYRATGHRLALQGQPGKVSETAFLEHRRAVSAKWDALFGELSD